MLLALIVLFVIFGFYVAYLGVPPVPTRRQELGVVMELAKIRPNDVVVDLGCGDGYFLERARSLGARIRGWELNFFVWLLAKIRLGWRSQVYWRDLWSADLTEVDVVYTFLMPRLMARVEREIWSKMKVGARLVSNAFPMPTIKPTKTLEGVYLYIKD